MAGSVRPFQCVCSGPLMMCAMATGNEKLEWFWDTAEALVKFQHWSSGKEGEVTSLAFSV